MIPVVARSRSKPRGLSGCLLAFPRLSFSLRSKKTTEVHYLTLDKSLRGSICVRRERSVRLSHFASVCHFKSLHEEVNHTHCSQRIFYSISQRQQTILRFWSPQDGRSGDECCILRYTLWFFLNCSTSMRLPGVTLLIGPINFLSVPSTRMRESCVIITYILKPATRGRLWLVASLLGSWHVSL